MSRSSCYSYTQEASSKNALSFSSAYVCASPYNSFFARSHRQAARLIMVLTLRVNSIEVENIYFLEKHLFNSENSLFK